MRLASKFLLIFGIILATLKPTMAASTSSFDLETNIVSKKSDENLSEANRTNKKYSLVSEFAIGTMDANGFGASYFLDLNSNIVLDFYKYSKPLAAKVIDSVAGSDDQLKGSSMGAHYKRFLGNSFFIRAGVDYRQIEFARGNSNSSFRGTATNAVFAIGNDWQWGYFTMGFDWYRLYLPMASQIIEESNLTSTNRQLLADTEDSYLKKSSGMIGFHLGASF